MEMRSSGAKREIGDDADVDVWLRMERRELCAATRYE